MNKDNYHHGTLKEDLIKKGIMLINEEGVAGFSLRKVASLCGVSHTAPYKHFKNKEELLSAISECVSREFSEYLREVSKRYEGPRCMVEMGKAYVSYMVQNKEYFEFMFLGELKLQVKLENSMFTYDEACPFSVFHKTATEVLGAMITDVKRRDLVILNMWSQVHGLANFIVNQTLQYDGDIELLVEAMLTVQCN